MQLFTAGARTWITSTVAIAATVIVLSGCGGSSSSSSSSSATTTAASSSQTSQTSQTSESAGQFKAAIAAVIGQFKSASQATGVALQQAGSKSDAQLSTIFQQLDSQWSAALDKLKTIQPPPQLTAAFERLKLQVSNVKADLSAIVTAAQNHDATAAKNATSKLVSDIVGAKSSSTGLTNGS